MERVRRILHVDMDAFFTSVEQRDFPEYAGRPVVVGADPKGGTGRGVVSAASYEARRFGIHSAMPISRAYHLCPDAVFLVPRMRRYSEISREIMTIFGKFSPIIEQISVDEAFLDCTGCESLFGDDSTLAQKIKSRVKEQTGLCASIGVASNKSVAKIASDLQKPDGLTVCPAGHEKEFLAPLSVSRLWGAGPKACAYLNSLGFKLIGDIARVTPETMQQILGANGRYLWELASGIDSRDVSNETSYKSVSEEYTFEHDTSDIASIEHVLLDMSDHLARRLRRMQSKGRTVRIKIRVEGFETYTRSYTVEKPVDDIYRIKDVAYMLFRNFELDGRLIRLIGLAVGNLVDAASELELQLNLFSEQEKEVQNSKRIEAEKVLDQLRTRFGKHVTRGSLVVPPRKYTLIFY